MENNKLLKGLLIGAIIFFVLITTALIYYKVISAVNDKSGRISSIAEHEATDAKRRQESSSTSQVDFNVEVQGGSIRFYPAGGAYTEQLRLQLSFDHLKSLNGYIIASNIYYTTNGTEPTKANSQKYLRGGFISLSKKGIFIIKARLISEVGKYEGAIYSQTYSIQLAIGKKPSNQTSISRLVTQETTPENNIIKNFDFLDIGTKDDIRENMKLITLEVEGIDNIKKDGDLKILLAVSKEGLGKVMDISGFVVEPEGKLEEIKKALNEKIKGIDFNPPTLNENPVDIAIWVDFKKVAKFYEKVIFER